MGGNQSWLACDATYPTQAPSAQQKQATEGSLLIAAMILVFTVTLVLAVTCAAHCIVISRRFRRQHRRRSTSLMSPEPADKAGSANVTFSSNAVIVEVESGSESEDEDEDEESEDDDVDSVTARAMRQVTANRRMSTWQGAGGSQQQQQQQQQLNHSAGFENRGFV